jgi:hypothetical protein
MSRRVPRFVKSALALVCNVRLNGSISSKDYNVFVPIFHTTAEALCVVKKLAKFFTTMFHLVFTLVLRKRRNEVLKKAPLEGAIRKNQPRSRDSVHLIGRRDAALFRCIPAPLLHCYMTKWFQWSGATALLRDRTGFFNAECRVRKMSYGLGSVSVVWSEWRGWTSPAVSLSQPNL